MALVLLLLALAVVLSIICLAYLLKDTLRKREVGEPPLVKATHILWGSAKDFSEDAARFFHKCRDDYGEVFTIRLLHQNLTVLMNPHDLDTFAHQKNFDFDSVQREVNKNVYDFIIKDTPACLRQTIKAHKGDYLERSLFSFADNLKYAYTNVDMARSVNDQGWSHDLIREFCAKTCFNAIFNSIYGKSDDQPFNSWMFYKEFEIYHRYFNAIWLGVPKRMFPKAMKSYLELLKHPKPQEVAQRSDASEFMKITVEHFLKNGQTESDIVGSNLVYLHVNYNTARLCFWLINNVLFDEAAHYDLNKEMDELVDKRTKENGTAEVSLADVDELPVLDSIVKESARLASGVFMIRYIKKDTWFPSQNGKKYLIKKGHQITMYPPAYHKDPEVFPKPETFQYNRFVNAKFYKNGAELKNPVMLFGTLCVGKRLAISQMKWFIFTLFSSYQLQPVSMQSAVIDVTCHGREILPPVEDIDFRYRARTDRPAVVLV